MLGLDVAIKFPIQFDVDKLQHDLEIAKSYEMYKHPLKNHDGSWQAINLVYAGGALNYTHGDAYGKRPGYGAEPPKSTELLDQCKYFQEVLNSFDAPILMARVSSLPAGGKILHHADPIESIDFGQLRLHIPIITHHKVVYYLGHSRQRWREGEVWYGDFTFPHRVANFSDIDRYHVILDVERTDRLMSYFPRRYLDRASRREKFRKFQRDLVWYESRISKKFGILKEWAPAPESNPATKGVSREPVYRLNNDKP